VFEPPAFGRHAAVKLCSPTLCSDRHAARARLGFSRGVNVVHCVTVPIVGGGRWCRAGVGGGGTWVVVKSWQVHASRPRSRQWSESRLARMLCSCSAGMESSPPNLAIATPPCGIVHAPVSIVKVWLIKYTSLNYVLFQNIDSIR
jgi:hypothetical protein